MEIVVWDEKKEKGKLAQMFISYDSQCINSLAFQYIEGDQFTLSPIFGSQNLDAPNFETVTFMDGSDNEYYITRVSWSHGIIDNQKARGLKTLTIETNEKTYGPFGYPYSDTNFNISLGFGDQFGGFHGTASSDIIKSIGVGR
ncbi:hypothetical protein SOVF_108430 [Spinacia oleracea]|nr:hypothetical protein SOVF_108430 [Spinacia oleracea]